MNNLNRNHSTTIKPHKDIFMRSHVNELVNEVKHNVENGVTSVSIDFSEIENIDIIGFGILRTVQKISITNNVHIKLFNVKDNVQKILENSCLILDIIHNEGEEESSIHEEIALIA
ncbi:MAG: STAS domain-containing protein [bacterium]|nr:STAS domain-containing protein [bacterium]